MKSIIRWLILFSFYSFNFSHGAVSITAPSSPNMCTGGSFVTLGNIVVLENLDADFSTTGGVSKTLILSAPTGFEFKSGTGNLTEAGGGSNLSSLTMAVTSSAITVSYICGGTNQNDGFTISNIQIRSTTANSTVTLKSSVSSTSVISGITHNSTSFATLNISAGTSKTVAVAGGDWNTAGTWSPSGVPSGCDNITIDQNVTIASGTNANCYNLTINNGSTLTINSTTDSLKIQGSLTNSGIINHAGAAGITCFGQNKTIGGSGTFTNFKCNFGANCTYTFSSNISFHTFRIYTDGNTSLSTYTATINTSMRQYGTINLNSGVFEVKCFNQSYDLTKFNHNTGTYYWNNRVSGLGFNLLDDDWYNVKLGGGAGTLIHITEDMPVGNNFIIEDGVQVAPWYLYGAPVNGYIYYSISIGGNFINYGTFTARALSSHTVASDFVTFNGTGNQYIQGDTITTFYNLTENKASGTLYLDLDCNTEGTVNLQNGPFDLNTHTLQVYRGLTTANSSNLITRTNGYIISENTSNLSKIKWYAINIAKHTFPFGTSDGTYIPFEYDATGGTAGYVTVSTYPTAADNTPFPTAPVAVTHVGNNNLTDNSANTVDRFWQIDLQNAQTANLRFYYKDSEKPANGEDSLRAQRWSSGWQDALSSQVANATSNWVYVPNVSTFSPWTLARMSSPLPVNLSNFKTECSDNQNIISWQTLSEKNNLGFEIEKSYNGEEFFKIGFVSGNGNSNTNIKYSYIDKNSTIKTAYYRLKQIDFDGKYEYSEIINVKGCGNVNAGIEVFPIPAKEILYVNLTENNSYELNKISIKDASGKLVKTEQSNESEIEINISELPKGIYFIEVTNSFSNRVTKFVK